MAELENVLEVAGFLVDLRLQTLHFRLGLTGTVDHVQHEDDSRTTLRLSQRSPGFADSFPSFNLEEPNIKKCDSNEDIYENCKSIFETYACIHKR